MLTNGEIVTGTNVENVSYGLTLCAERSALVLFPVADGLRTMPFSALLPLGFKMKLK